VKSIERRLTKLESRHPRNEFDYLSQEELEEELGTVLDEIVAAQDSVEACRTCCDAVLSDRRGLPDWMSVEQFSDELRPLFEAAIARKWPS
jgi:hypothetical protein